MSDIPYMMDNTQEEFERVRDLAWPELKTPDEWCKIKGFRIMDPDGWRGHDRPDWDCPLTEEAFMLLAAESTIDLRGCRFE